MNRALSLRALTLACIPLLGSLACSANKTTGTFDTGATAESTTSAGGASPTGAGGDKSASTGTGDGGSLISGSGGAGGTGGMDSCAQATAKAKLIPLNMFIAVDKSGSMSDNNKWGNVQSAFTTFFQDPNAAGLGVALRFWPDDNGGCQEGNDPTCADVIPLCEIPEVDVGPLSDPAHVKALLDAFASHMPNGGTPTSAALSGADKWAAKYMFAKNHTEQAVVLLVTDGDPTSCDTDITDISNIADNAYQGAGVLTFAVGLDGSEPQTMNQFAMGGHTGMAFMIGNGNAAADLLNALKKIQAAAVSCTFVMPMPPDPKDQIDLNQVYVNYTPGVGMKVTFDQVPSPAQCGAKGGWYYDDPAKPTTINLCPATCTKIQADNAAQVDIFLGCIKKGPA